MAPLRPALIVDPDPVTRRVITECLRKLNPQIPVLACEDDAMARRHLASDPGAIGLLFCELKTARIDGMGLIQSLKSFPQDQAPSHVFLCSDLLSPDATLKSSERISFIPKPIDAPGLLEILCNHVDNPLEPAAPKPPITAAVFNTFCQGMNQFFTRMLSSDIGRDRLHLRKDEPLSGDIGAVMELRCRSFTGRMLILMSDDCHQKISERLNINSDDLVAEIANQVFGYSKMILNDIGFGFELSIPKVVRGNDCRFEPARRSELLVHTKFMSEFGEFDLEIQIQQRL